LELWLYEFLIKNIESPYGHLVKPKERYFSSFPLVGKTFDLPTRGKRRFKHYQQINDRLLNKPTSWSINQWHIIEQPNVFVNKSMSIIEQTNDPFVNKSMTLY
jgi:hypothetical protein